MAITGLPTASIPFIGRDGELAGIMRLLGNPACRLLTLVGPGGIGKTRLALEAARLQLDAFANGVYLVALQPLSSPDFIVPTIAESLHFQFYPGGEPKQQLLDFLRDKSALLVLDNLEHLLDGVDLLSEILASVPDVRILATSRERLNLVEEWLFDVPGLSFPSSEAETEIEHYSAVQLFIQCARRVQAGFTLIEAHKPTVTRICRLVGGMPLGIELAAAWVRALPTEAIAGEIERSLDILETPARNVEPRHRNMRAAFEPTWNRLSEEERRVFRQLSVFRGGFTRQAAEAVTGATLRILTGLVDKSLLRVDANGRYQLHELLRQYAEGQLDTAPEEQEQAHDLHCRYFAAFLDQRWEQLKGRQQKQALVEIEAEIDNVRKAWLGAVTHGKEAEIGMAMDSLRFFYDTRGWYQEGERIFGLAAETLGRIGTKEGVIRGRLLAKQGGFCYTLNLCDRTRQLLHESLAILRAHDAHREVGYALLSLSEEVLFLENDPSQAKLYVEHSLTLFQETGDQRSMAYALWHLGFVALYLGDYAEARRVSRQCLAIYRQNGDEYGTAIALIVLGFSTLELGDSDEAKRVGQESLAMCREIGLQWTLQNALILTGGATCALGEYREAKQYLHEALRKANELHTIPESLWTLVEIANFLGRIGRGERAVEIAALCLHSPTPPVLGKGPATRLLTRLKGELPSDVFEAALQRGQARDVEATVQEVITELSQVDEDAASLMTTQSTLDILTTRELEILHLIADGLSNRQIGDRLILSEGTVKWYSTQLYAKLGVQNRAQAVRRAQQLNLIS